MSNIKEKYFPITITEESSNDTKDVSEDINSLYDVLDKIAKNWTNYSSVQQAAIAKAFAGQRLQEAFCALTEKYNSTKLQKLLDTSSLTSCGCNNKVKVYFAKTNPKAIIPSKRDEDAGYDIFPCIDEDIVIQPHTTVMIPTGIASACTPDYFFKLVERGSSGSKGIAQRCGVIDSGYRDSWFVPVTNTNEYPIVIPAEKECEYLPYSTDNYKRTNNYFMVYPFGKAITQAILLPVPKTEIEEISYDNLKNIESERGTGCLGSSGK